MATWVALLFVNRDEGAAVRPEIECKFDNFGPRAQRALPPLGYSQLYFDPHYRFNAVPDAPLRPLLLRRPFTQSR